MFESVNVIGRGRVGTAVAARLEERGVELREDRAELVLLCVPDTAIRGVARDVVPGPAGSRTSAAARRSRHSIRTSGGSGSTPCRRSRAREGRSSSTAPLPRSPLRPQRPWSAVSSSRACLGLEPFELADDAAAAVPRRAAIASNYLVTLHKVASELFRAAGAPPEALVPLMRRTIDNGFELTGPIERGDWETVEAHREAIRSTRPDLEPLYDVLAEATRS
jgi:hypothetical protein